ncbi:MAG: glycosyltransferase [Elusimicrobiota bacterium]|nr:glycosyltransferase [Endomicrobiia bacterium]MDW8166191.1 glycosyltransferase [Elusimicrobiota bacterium]
MRIAYITAKAPYGKGETFIIDEINMLKKLKVDVVIFPRNPDLDIFHGNAKSLAQYTYWLPLINLKILLIFLLSLINFKLWYIVYNIIKNSRDIKILIKNLGVLPKAVYLANLFKKLKIDHIHAHWGSTTSTMGYVISLLTGIPWSFTLHRWDISENNMLNEKIKNAIFVRIISKNGYNELLKLIDKKYKTKIKIIYVGVEIPKILKNSRGLKKEMFTIGVPANLVLKKGHIYLIEACKLLFDKGIKNFKCIFFGDGPLRRKLEDKIKEYKLEEYIEIQGMIPNEYLKRLYELGAIDLVVLPSIMVNEKELEGIPVALMEAMSYGIPVISTNTGGIPELIDDAGIIVPDKDPCSLANAIEECLTNEKYRVNLGLLGRRKVMQDFNLKKNVKILLYEIKR